MVAAAAQSQWPFPASCFDADRLTAGAVATATRNGTASTTMKHSTAMVVCFETSSRHRPSRRSTWAAKLTRGTSEKSQLYPSTWTCRNEIARAVIEKAHNTVQRLRVRSWQRMTCTTANAHAKSGPTIIKPSFHQL